MKIILKTDIEGLGYLGDVVEVKPGYARNYLFPKNFALKYNQHNIDQIKVKREKHQKKIEVQKLSAIDLKTKIDELVITISKQAGKKDTLFGSVKVNDIAKELAELGYEIDNKNIKLEQPIKSLGNYSIPIKLFADVIAEIKVKVISKDQKPAELIDEKQSSKDKKDAADPKDQQDDEIIEKIEEQAEETKEVPKKTPKKLKKKKEVPQEPVTETKDSAEMITTDEKPKKELVEKKEKTETTASVPKPETETKDSAEMINTDEEPKEELVEKKEKTETTASVPKPETETKDSAEMINTDEEPKEELVEKKEKTEENKNITEKK